MSSAKNEQYAPTYENVLRFRRQEINSHGSTTRVNKHDECILFEFFNKDYVESRRISTQDFQEVDQESKGRSASNSNQNSSRIARLLKPANDQSGSRWCHVSQHDSVSLNFLAKLLSLGRAETTCVATCDGWEVCSIREFFMYSLLT